HDHLVADARLLALIVSVHRARRAHDLVVAAVAAGRVDPDRDRLGRAIGDDHALAGLELAGRMLARRGFLDLALTRACLLARPQPGPPPDLALAPPLGVALGLALLRGHLWPHGLSSRLRGAGPAPDLLRVVG